MDVEERLFDMIESTQDEIKTMRKEEMMPILQKLNDVDKKLSLASLRINGAWGAIAILGGGLWYIVQTMLSK